MEPDRFPSPRPTPLRPTPRRATPRRALLLLPLLALLGFLAVDHSALVPPPHGDKPMFPVQVALALGDVPPAGGEARVLASVTAWAPGETVEWRLTLPEGVTLLEGPDRWTGTLERGATRQFEIRIFVPDDRPHDLYASARLPERPRATAGASLTVDAGASDAPQATRAAGVGQDYLQYQGEVRPRETAPGTGAGAADAPGPRR